MIPTKICVVTGTRAEYGLLHELLVGLRDDPAFASSVVVTGMHLSPEFGRTIDEIEADGIEIADQVEMLLSSDSPVGVAKSIGLGTIGFADVFRRLEPQVLVLLGDRFEILAAAQAALMARIPIAHIGGGDTTEGAVDEAIRHAITKMAHLHFVTHTQARARVIQLGEHPARVHVTGHPGLDRVRTLKPLTRSELEDSLGIRFRTVNLLLTYHPATLEEQSDAEPVRKILDAIERLGPDVGIVVTGANADAEGRIIMEEFRYAANRFGDRMVIHSSLGHHRYLSLMGEVTAVVGNSSSGLYEAPSFGIPTVNIGDRQKGRVRASSVIDVRPEADAIYEALLDAIAGDFSDVENPFGDGRSTQRILAVLRSIQDWRALLMKSFFDLKPALSTREASS